MAIETNGGASTLSVFPLSGMGLEVEESDFSWGSKVLLRTLGMIPGAMRNKMIFDGAPTDLLVQKAIQKCLGGPEPVRIRFTQGLLNGLRFECQSSHKYFLLGTAFEQNFQRELAELVDSNDVVYDVGSHFGWWTLWFSVAAKFVVAFEPSPVNFQSLRRNIEANHRTNVELHQVAASNSRGSISFVEDGSCSHVSLSSSPTDSVQVKTEQIDSFAGSHRPSLVKIDVEGNASEVLEGMADTLEQIRPRLLMEIHDPTEESGVRGFLSQHTYKINEQARRSYPKRVLAFPESN